MCFIRSSISLTFSWKSLGGGGEGLCHSHHWSLSCWTHSSLRSENCCSKYCMSSKQSTFLLSASTSSSVVHSNQGTLTPRPPHQSPLTERRVAVRVARVLVSVPVGFGLQAIVVPVSSRRFQRHILSIYMNNGPTTSHAYTAAVCGRVQ